MAKVDPVTGNMSGRMGGMIFQTYFGNTYAHSFTKSGNPRTETQQAHRSNYGQWQHLGTSWLYPFIKSYRNSGIAAGSAYRQFIHYNWTNWDKHTIAWKSGVPFYGFNYEVSVEVLPNPVIYPASIKVTIPPEATETYRYVSFFMSAGFDNTVPQETLEIPSGQDYVYISSSKLENWNQLFCDGLLSIKVWCSDSSGIPFSNCKTLFLEGGILNV